jgi:ADP-ribose pyrophosphatase YjhB (NUDIX family)
MQTIITAFALITKNGKILLIQEGFYPAYGQWCLPGGHMDENEDMLQAAAREALEETGGLEIKIANKLLMKTVTNAEYQGRPEEHDKMIEINIFQAKVLAGKIDKNKLTEELDARWFSKNEAIRLPLRWDWLKELF